MCQTPDGRCSDHKAQACSRSTTGAACKTSLLRGRQEGSPVLSLFRLGPLRNSRPLSASADCSHSCPHPPAGGRQSPSIGPVSSRLRWWAEDPSHHRPAGQHYTGLAGSPGELPAASRNSCPCPTPPTWGYWSALPHHGAHTSSFQDDLESFKLVLVEGVQVKALQLRFALGLQEAADLHFQLFP